MRIIDEFLISAKSADTDELAKAAIKTALSKGADETKLKDAILSSLSSGQNMRRPLGEEAAHAPVSPENNNLQRVLLKIS